MISPSSETPEQRIARLTAELQTTRDLAAKTERNLKQQREFLEQAQEVASIGSWITDLDESDHLTWSREMYNILGRPIGDLPTQSRVMAGYVHPDDREVVQIAREAAISSGQPLEIEHRIVRHDGVERWVRTRADLVRGPDGRPIRMVGTLQDITGRRELEDQLRQSQKLEAIGRLAGGISHDLNNALTIIIGYSELVAGALSEDDPVRRDVLEIRRAAERAESVTRQLLTFSRKQWLEPRAFQLGEVVTTQVSMLKRLLSTSIELVTIVEPDIPCIHGDPGQVGQAIVNLALNARDAMPDGGTLTLRVAPADLDAAFARAHPPMAAGRYIELSMTDTGDGMTAETRSRIFEPFFTTKGIGRGTGLGLAMVYGTMKQSGGLVVVESEPARGAVFRLYFPAIPAVPAPGVASHDPPHEIADPALATILVVDDEPGVRRLAAAALATVGYRVLQAESGGAALRVSADAGSIDLLLTDLSMPEMTGLQLAVSLTRTRPALRVILMSGYIGEERPVSNTEHPMGFLQKPFTPKDLRQKVHQALGGAGNRLE